MNRHRIDSACRPGWDQWAIVADCNPSRHDALYKGIPGHLDGLAAICRYCGMGDQIANKRTPAPVGLPPFTSSVRHFTFSGGPVNRCVARAGAARVRAESICITDS